MVRLFYLLIGSVQVVEHVLHASMQYVHRKLLTLLEFVAYAKNKPCYPWWSRILGTDETPGKAVAYRK